MMQKPATKLTACIPHNHSDGMCFQSRRLPDYMVKPKLDDKSIFSVKLRSPRAELSQRDPHLEVCRMSQEPNLERWEVANVAGGQWIASVHFSTALWLATSHRIFTKARSPLFGRHYVWITKKGGQASISWIKRWKQHAYMGHPLILTHCMRAAPCRKAMDTTLGDANCKPCPASPQRAALLGPCHHQRYLRHAGNRSDKSYCRKQVDKSCLKRKLSNFWDFWNLRESW